MSGLCFPRPRGAPMNRPAFRQGESRGLETSGKQKAPNSQRAAKFFRRQAGWLFGLLLFPFAPVPAMLAEDRDEGQQAGGAKEFFSPADEFPGNPQGYKIIGKFKVSAFSNGGYFLQADSARGEKDAMRRFVPRDDSIESGQTYTFTRERPMVIVSKSFLGQYDVDLPDNLLTDQAVEQHPCLRPSARGKAEKGRLLTRNPECLPEAGRLRQIGLGRGSGDNGAAGRN
ncbi:hypothetical protein EBX31_08275 [bacterium]|nr:hypothetical protein [bacterium]